MTPNKFTAKFIRAANDNVGVPYIHKGSFTPKNGNWCSGLDFVGHIAMCYKAATGKDFPLKSVPEYAPNGLDDLGDSGWLQPLLMNAGFTEVARPVEGDVIEFDVVGNKFFYTAAIMTDTDQITSPYWGRSCTKAFYAPYWCKFATRFWRYNPEEENTMKILEEAP